MDDMKCGHEKYLNRELADQTCVQCTAARVVELEKWQRQAHEHCKKFGISLLFEDDDDEDMAVCASCEHKRPHGVTFCPKCLPHTV